MTREDIIRLAREAGMAEPTEFLYNNYWTAGQSELERFAELVAAAEREECARVCDDFDPPPSGLQEDIWVLGTAVKLAAAIRARG